MKKLKNWDNQTWLSSKNYIFQFNEFLNKRVRFNKNTKILDIGCGRANIISALKNRYKFQEKPIGLDIVKNKGIKRNIIFKKIDGYDYLKRKKITFQDLGPKNDSRVDYPDYAHRVAKRVKLSKNNKKFNFFSFNFDLFVIVTSCYELLNIMM